MKILNSGFRSGIRRLWQSMIIPLTLALAVPSIAIAQKNDTPLRFNWGAPTADYPVLYVAIDQGLFKEVGLDPQFFWFPTGTPLLAGLKGGSIDVFTTGLATVFALGQKIPLTFIGWETDSSAGEGLIVSSQSPVASYRDIAGAKAVGAPQGTCAQVALGLLARKAGISYRSLNVVNVPPPLYANAFKSGSIDAGVAWAPYAHALQEQGYKVVNWDADYAPPEGGVCPSLYGARPQFLKDHPDLGLKLVQVRAKALKLIADNPALAINALSKRLSISESVATAVYQRVSTSALPTFEQEITPGTPWSLVDENGGLARKLLIAGEILHEVGSIPAPLTLSQINGSIDSSYIRRYLEQTKP